jgi:hypothetical protein
MRNVFFVSALALSLGACAPVMEFNRPDPIDLTQFHTGQHRLEVVKVLGPPLTSVNDGPNSCDIYHLYTHGPNGAGKASIAFVEGVADVFTLGIAEAVSTPVEAGTKNSLYPVTMCYSQDAILVSLEEASQPVGAPPAPAPSSATAANATATPGSGTAADTVPPAPPPAAAVTDHAAQN